MPERRFPPPWSVEETDARHRDHGGLAARKSHVIARIKAFGEPVVDRSEKLASLNPLRLIAPEGVMLIAGRSSSDLAPCVTGSRHGPLKAGFDFTG